MYFISLNVFKVGRIDSNWDTVSRHWPEVIKSHHFFLSKSTMWTSEKFTVFCMVAITKTKTKCIRNAEHV